MQTEDFIQKCINKNIVFAAYSLVGSNKIELIYQTKPKAITLNGFEDLNFKKGFAVFPFSNKSPALLIEKQYYFTNTDNLKIHFKNIENLSHPSINSKLAEPTSKEDYFKMFRKIKPLLDSKEIQKIVLSRVQHQLINFNASTLFKKLTKKYKDAFVYIINSPESGCWIGASPEILYQNNTKIINTVALAGTQPINQDNNYKWGNKDIEEQKLVIDDIIETIKRYVPVSEIKMENTTQIAANVVHLKTLISFPSEYIENKVGNFLNLLHPTPAVCGLPLLKVKKLIEETEVYNREYYTGFLGPINIKTNTESDLFVNLRCLKFSKNKVALFIGGGIISSSNEVDEWNETKLKAKTLLKVIEKLNNISDE